jgi:phosphatidylethanolamine-binding protein (PEBP) family uncharacterized protein
MSRRVSYSSTLVIFAMFVMLTGEARAAEPFTLTSTAFVDGAAMPAKYAGHHPSRQPPCGGENVSPPLVWSEGEASTSPKEWAGGKNNVGTDHYFGPCGPAGDAPHHYIITLIATSVEPGQMAAGLTREELLQALRGKALAPASIVGKYVRGM